MKIHIKIFFSAVLVLSIAFVSPSDKTPKITSGEISDHIKYLSSDELAGRFPGQKETGLQKIILLMN
jgi:hypothetical protein